MNKKSGAPWRCSGVFLWTETFKNGYPAFFYGGIVFFLGSQGPADGHHTQHIPADEIAQGLPVRIPVGNKIGNGKTVKKVKGQQKFEDPGCFALCA